MVFKLKKSLLCVGVIGLIMVVLSMSITQVHAQGSLGTIQVEDSNGNRSGISGSVGIFDIYPNALVEVTCQIRSIQGMVGSTLVQRSSGPGWRPFFCPFGVSPSPVGSYYWVIIFATITNPCATAACDTKDHTLISIGTPVWIA